jgi:putative transposase
VPTQWRKNCARTCSGISCGEDPCRDRRLARRERELGEVIEDVARARLIIWIALEAEAGGFAGPCPLPAVGRRPGGCPGGDGNDYRAATVRTTAERVTIARPKLRATTEAFASKLFGSEVTRSDALEALVIGGFVPGPAGA